MKNLKKSRFLGIPTLRVLTFGSSALKNGIRKKAQNRQNSSKFQILIKFGHFYNFYKTEALKIAKFKMAPIFKNF